MNQDWQNFLAQQGAQVEESVVQHFGDPQAELLAARDGTVLCDLGQFCTLKVAGEDAPAFLQNLLSSDVKAVTPGQAQLSSFNSPKGRMLASFLLWRRGADYFLQLPRSLSAAIQKKLSMYVLRSKVKVTDISDEMVCLGVSGADAVALLKKNVTSQLPQELYGVEAAVHQSGIGPSPYFTVIRLGDNRFQVSTASQYAPALWPSLAAVARPAGAACWGWLNIRSGIPVITPATQEQFVLQMTNYDALGGVSFKKGCYPGQEIVARTQYLGKLKRRMYLAHVDSDCTPQAGDELFSAEMAGQPSGMVVNAAPAPGGGFDLLAVLQISSHETQSVHLQSLAGAALNFLPLPYAIPA